MLADQTDYVIGVDTHRDRHSAAILATSGGLVGQTNARADRAGYAALLTWASQHATGRRVWAVEGTGSYGAGLAAFLGQSGEQFAVNGIHQYLGVVFGETGHGVQSPGSRSSMTHGAP